MGKKKFNSLVFLPALVLIAVLLCMEINHFLNTDSEREKVKIYTPSGEITDSYDNFKEYSNDITSPTDDGMPNYIDADNTVVADGTNATNYTYCGNKNSKVYHKISCGSLAKTKDTNKVYLTTKEEYTNQGYKPCSRCKP